jgi:hypothetical protein
VICLLNIEVKLGKPRLVRLSGEKLANTVMCKLDCENFLVNLDEVFTP